MNSNLDLGKGCFSAVSYLIAFAGDSYLATFWYKMHTPVNDLFLFLSSISISPLSGAAQDAISGRADGSRETGQSHLLDLPHTHHQRLLPHRAQRHRTGTVAQVDPLR